MPVEPQLGASKLKSPGISVPGAASGPNLDCTKYLYNRMAIEVAGAGP